MDRRLTTHRVTNRTTKINAARVHLHTLRDGGRILVRALRADDRNEMAARYEELSPASRRLRFFNAPKHLSGRLLDYLVDVED